MQLIELNVPMVIALNMMDEVTQSGGSIDINGLEAALGVPVIPISASKNEGIEELAEHIINVAKYVERPEKADFCKSDDEKHHTFTQISLFFFCRYDKILLNK